MKQTTQQHFSSFTTLPSADQTLRVERHQSKLCTHTVCVAETSKDTEMFKAGDAHRCFMKRDNAEGTGVQGMVKVERRRDVERVPVRFLETFEERRQLQGHDGREVGVLTLRGEMWEWDT